MAMRFLWIAFCAAAVAQPPVGTASIEGRVLTTSGAPLPRAKIVIEAPIADSDTPPLEYYGRNRCRGAIFLRSAARGEGVHQRDA